MRNRILFITRNTIPYVKELQPLAGSVAGCILMQQLDYWFERFPDGFWKFLEPSNHSKYRPGDSWIEELGLSVDEFRTAFDRLGIRYKSKGIFDEAQDKFQRKFYCSYQDRRENLTHYYRNHDLVDKALDELITNKEQAVTVNGESPVTVKWEPPFTGNWGSQSTQIEKVHLQEIEKPHFNNTEIISSEITQIPLPQQSAVSEESCCGSESALVFPQHLIEEEKSIIFGLIRHLQLDTQQKLLAELEGALNLPGTIKRSPMAFLEGLVKKEKLGKFALDLGVTVLANRKKQVRNLTLVRAVAELKADPAVQAKGESIVNSVRARMEKQKQVQVGLLS